MRARGVGSIRAAMVTTLLTMGCGSDDGNQATPSTATGLDAGVDAGCPDYPDSGVVVLMRGCPLTIPYRVQ